MPWDETEWAQSGEWGLDAVSAAEVEAPAEDGSRGAPAENVRGGRRRQEAATAAAEEEGEPEGHGHVRLGQVGRWVLPSLSVKHPLRRSPGPRRAKREYALAQRQELCGSREPTIGRGG